MSSFFWLPAGDEMEHIVSVRLGTFLVRTCHFFNSCCLERQTRGGNPKDKPTTAGFILTAMSCVFGCYSQGTGKENRIGIISTLRWPSQGSSLAALGFSRLMCRAGARPEKGRDFARHVSLARARLMFGLALNQPCRAIRTETLWHR